MIKIKIILLIRTRRLLTDLLTSTRDVRNTDDGFPASTFLYGASAWVTETSGAESSLCPSIVDAGEMPFDKVRSCIAVELVADINKALDRCNIDAVDGGKV
jgi:hypothetical protein